MEELLILVVAAMVAGTCYFVATGKPAFTLVIADGKVQVQGRPPHGFAHEAEDICREAGIHEAVVKGYPRRRHQFSLSFSRQVPPSARQRFRNALTFCC